MRLLEPRNVEDIAIGAAVLGTGGGGDPYLGKVVATRWIEQYGPLKVVTADELADDVLVVSPCVIGSPVPLTEKFPLAKEMVYAFEALAQYLGRPIGAVMPIEIGGANSIVPFAVGSQLGLPVIDADCMGRAFPEVQLVTLTLFGFQATPMAIADERKNSVIVNTMNNRWAERLGRSAAIDMGAIAGAAVYPITVADVKRAAILGTLTFCEEIGAAIRDANTAKTDPIGAVIAATGGFRLFQGKIVDVQRRIQAGFARGETRLDGVGDYAGRTMTIRFQNENLVAIENEEVLVSVPDLITILDTERGEPITTEYLRYGFRVTVLGIPCDAKWRTPEGIALAGPRYFGYDIDYVPVERRFGDGRR